MHTYKYSTQTKGQVPLGREVIKPSCKRGSHQITNSLTSQQESICGTKLLNANKVHKDGRCEAVVSRDAESIGCRKSKDHRVGGDKGDDCCGSSTDQHTDSIKTDA